MKYTTLKPYVTVDDVKKMANYLSVGDTISIETLNLSGKEVKEFIEVKATILEKYPHIALTDKGSCTWNTITLLNKELLRGIR